MFNAECHCKNIKLLATEPPATLTSCNCSICNRLGALWGYFDEGNVQVVCNEKQIDKYSWGDEKYTYHRCRRCGCTTHYTCTEKNGNKIVAINCRMAPLSDIADIVVRSFDGLDTWKYFNE